MISSNLLLSNLPPFILDHVILYATLLATWQVKTASSPGKTVTLPSTVIIGGLSAGEILHFESLR